MAYMSVQIRINSDWHPLIFHYEIKWNLGDKLVRLWNQIIGLETLEKRIKRLEIRLKQHEAAREEYNPETLDNQNNPRKSGKLNHKSSHSLEPTNH